MNDYPDWLQLIQDVNTRPILLPWMLQNATPNYFTYLMAVINNQHRESWMLYTALNLIFDSQVDKTILQELFDILQQNKFDPQAVTALQSITPSN